MSEFAALFQKSAKNLPLTFYFFINESIKKAFFNIFLTIFYQFYKFFYG